MAGEGSRFTKIGYSTPKHLVVARGKTLFEWSLESLRKFREGHFIFVCRTSHDKGWIERTALEFGIKRVSVIQRHNLSLGQAQTAYDVLDLAVKNENLWIYNIDTYIEYGLNPIDIGLSSGCLHVFKSTNPSMSFVKFSKFGEVIEVAEKRCISNWASVGMYGFKNPLIFKHLYDRLYGSVVKHEVNFEYYIAPMYQLLIEDGKKVAAPILDESGIHILGTPEEVKIFDPKIYPI